MSRNASIGYRMADALFRHRRLFLISFLVICTVTMAAVYSRSKTFTATALTEVVTDNVAAALGQTDNTGWISPAQTNVNQLDDLLNGDFLATALSNANLQHPINADPRANDPRFVLLKKKLNTFTQSDHLYGIQLTWDNPTEAEEIVRAIQNQYIQEIGQEHFAQRNATIAFLNSQIATTGLKLQREEHLLTAYKASNVNGMPEAQSDAVGQLSALQAQMDNMKITAHDSTAQMAILQQQLDQIKPQSIAQQTTALSPLAAQLTDLKARRNALLVTMKPTHPLVLALDGQIKAMQKRLQAEYQAGGSSRQVTQTTLEDNPEWQSVHQQLLEAQIQQQTQQMQMQQIAKKIAQYTAIVQKIPAEQRTLSDKTRDYTLVQTEYSNLLQQRQQEQLAANLASVSASSSLTPIGYIQAEPTMRKAKLIAMFVGSLLLSLVVSLLLVILSEWMDHSLRYGSDAERLLGLPVLGVVSYDYELFQPKPVLPARRGPFKGLPAPAKKDKERPALETSAALGVNASAMEGTK